MKFKITRTSQMAQDCIDALSEKMPEAPCEGATLELGKFKVLGTIETLASGEKKPIRKLFREYGFYIEIDTLEDLVNLSRRYGDLIVIGGGGENSPEIEIYDDYRE